VLAAVTAEHAMTQHKTNDSSVAAAAADKAV